MDITQLLEIVKQKQAMNQQAGMASSGLPQTQQQQPVTNLGKNTFLTQLLSGGQQQSQTGISGLLNQSQSQPTTQQPVQDTTGIHPMMQTYNGILDFMKKYFGG